MKRHFRPSSPATRGQAFILLFFLLINASDFGHHSSYPSSTNGLPLLRQMRKVLQLPLHPPPRELTHHQLPTKTTTYRLLLLSSVVYTPTPAPVPLPTAAHVKELYPGPIRASAVMSATNGTHRSCIEMCSKDYSLVNGSSVGWYCFN